MVDRLGEILDSVDTIVVVGCSTVPAKAAHRFPPGCNTPAGGSFP